MNETVLQAIIAHIFGHKYYVNIINRKGTEHCEITSYIHQTKEAAEEHKQQIISTSSFLWVETVTFRSRRVYKTFFGPNGKTY